MSYQTQAAIGPYPVNCFLQALLTLALALAGTAAIDGVLPAPLSIFRLPFSVVSHRSGCRWLVTPLLLCCDGGFGSLAILAHSSCLVVDVTRSLT
jgi:hypothetical protein